MAIDSAHPAHTTLAPVWEMLTDSFEGEPRIKEKTTDYLPATAGMRLDGFPADGSTGSEDYNAYLLRAVYPDLYREAIQSNVGTMHIKPPVIQLPGKLEFMRESATPQGESLSALLRRVNSAQLHHGRVGLLGDWAAEGATVVPFINTYAASTVRNWSQTAVIGGRPHTTLVVLDESGQAMQPDLSWQHETKYRVIALVDPRTMQYSPNLGSVYATVTVDRDGVELESVDMEIPHANGRKLEELPFAIANSRDTVLQPNVPPMLGLALLALTIYRGEADYREALFAQGRDTLVEIGAYPEGDSGTARRTGTGSSIQVPLGGDAKYIGINSQGLSEQRTALENDYTRATQRGGQLLDATGGTAEAAEALRIRIAANTTTLPQVAMAGAAALEDVLRSLAVVMNANPDDVIVQPNLDFSTDVLDGQTLTNIMTSKLQGAPFSMRSIHAWGLDNGLTKMSYDDEMAAIAGEPGGMEL